VVALIISSMLLMQGGRSIGSLSAGIEIILRRPGGRILLVNLVAGSNIWTRARVLHGETD
jgi:hypothetical protein